MRILHLISYCPLVGEAARALTLAAAQREAGDEVAILTHPGGAPAAEAEHLGLPLITAPLDRGLRPARDLRALGILRRVIRERSIDILHVHRTKEHWLAVAGRGSGGNAPALVRTRHVLIPPRRHAANRWLYGRSTDRVACVSGVVRRSLSGALGLPEEWFPVIPGALPEHFRDLPPEDASAALRERLRIPENAAVLALVARCERVKGQAIALEALRMLRAEGRAVVLVLAWNRTTVYRLELEETIRRENLREAVRWLGPREDIRPLLRMSDLALVTSLGSEGWSRAALEAMASGRPVVASSVGSLPEIVREEATGLLVPHGDAKALAAAIRRLLDDDAERVAMGRAAREDALAYTVDQLRVRTRTVYEEALAARRGTP